MAYHEKARPKHQRGTHIGQSRNSEERSENRSDRDESYDSHGSFRTSREEHTQQRGYPQQKVNRDTDRRRHYASDNYAESEDRFSGLVMKTSHEINSHSHERVGGAFYERESSNRDHKTSYTASRSIRRQEGYDRKDEHTVHGKQHNQYHQKSHDGYKHKEQQYEETQSPAWAHSSASDVTSMKVTRKDRGNLDEHRGPTADYRSEQRHLDHHERPSSRGSSLSSTSDDPRDTDRLRRSRSPSHSGSRPRSESRHRGRRDDSTSNHSGIQKYSRSSHGRKHSEKRKHKDRSGSREDDRKRRKHKEREKDKEKERMRKRDEERRSVLTGKKIKLKVKKDKGDHERDANRKDLLQFLNSAFE